MTREELDQKIKAYADHYEIPIEILKAIISINSGWQVHNFKAIPRCKNDFFVGLTGISYSTAKYFGYEGTALELKSINENLEYCCKEIKFLLERYKDHADMWDYVYAGYNLNVAMRKDNGTFINQKQVEKYKNEAKKYKWKGALLNNHV